MAKEITSFALGTLLCLLVLECIFRILPTSNILEKVRLHEKIPLALESPGERFVYSRYWNYSIINEGDTNNRGFYDEVDYRLLTEEDQRKLRVALIGDSFLDAKMVAQRDCCISRIRKLGVENKANLLLRNYSLSGADLPSYVALTQYVESVFRPQIVVFVVNEEDIEKSFEKQRGQAVFSESGGIEFVEHRTSRIRRYLGKSALIRYIYVNLLLYPGNVVEVWKRTEVRNGPFGRLLKGGSGTENEILNRSHDAIQYFVNNIDSIARRLRAQVLIVLNPLQGEDGSVRPCVVPIKLFKEKAWKVYDLYECLKINNELGRPPLFFKKDRHWNREGHEVVANAIWKEIEKMKH